MLHFKFSETSISSSNDNFYVAVLSAIKIKIDMFIAKEIGKCCEVKLVAPPPLEKKLLLKKSNENYELYDGSVLRTQLPLIMIRVILSAFQMLLLVLRMD